MIPPIPHRPPDKRPATQRFRGRVLYLVDDSELMEAQLTGGRNLRLTDEITPAHVCLFYDETLGDFFYLGLSTVNPQTSAREFPVGRNAVKEGGFVCSVAGRRRGKGSSREASPYAELQGGPSGGRDGEPRADLRRELPGSGTPHATDFDIVRRIEEGEEIPLSLFVAGRDEITRQVIEYGGLFECNVARLQGKAAVPLPPPRRLPAPAPYDAGGENLREALDRGRGG